MSDKKIPIVVGVTGHRRIVDDDKTELKAQVQAALVEIREMCKSKDGGSDTPIIMLNAFAQGADMLCAEAAFDLGIPVYAVLPCPEEEYAKSFDDETDKGKLHKYLDEKAQRQIIVPDIEQNRAWMNIPADNYRYRQLGIYVAEHSHILIALWDGKEPQEKFGCGTVEVIKFALEHNFLDKDHLFKPGKINDSAVVWINARRQGDPAPEKIQRKWLISNLANRFDAKDDKQNATSSRKLDEAKTLPLYVESSTPPKFLEEIISKTVEYNSETVSVDENNAELWKENRDGELDEYRKGLSYHYSKANELAGSHNQTHYNRFLLAIAILGTLVALTFLIYDDASIPYMIFPCTILLGVILLLVWRADKKAFHKDYIKYRAFAEALRIQFYMSMCIKEDEAVVNVCDLYSWTQKVDMVWIDKAIQALAVINCSRKLDVDPDEIIDAWIGRNETPEGQLRYHNRKKPVNQKKAKMYKKLSRVFKIVAVVIYALIFAIEVAACILRTLQQDWFWEGYVVGQVSCRNFAAIILGAFAAGSLLMSGYWGKLSYDRKADDNEKMSVFYASAYERWQDVKTHPDEVEKFVTEIAREEIVENGIWCSYVSENSLEVNI